LISNDRYMANVWQGQFTEAGENHRISLDRDGYRYLAPIGMYRANRWGVMGAIGNVWEYTSDWYDPEYFQYLATEYPEGAVNPTGPEHGTLKVGRGGSWWCSDETCRGFGLFYRGHGRPDQSFPNQGFRCARSITE
ncbi:MAG: SUMF1/EgtB/PvdO family nonheme iron enzyme, partial [Leptospiraceae bacterium]|nr:SUMF1/EgtB/PvdO family nonheme iron enzyme [Leptospiraceae bacterium]